MFLKQLNNDCQQVHNVGIAVYPIFHEECLIFPLFAQPLVGLFKIPYLKVTKGEFRLIQLLLRFYKKVYVTKRFRPILYHFILMLTVPTYPLTIPEIRKKDKITQIGSKTEILCVLS